MTHPDSAPTARRTLATLVALVLVALPQLALAQSDAPDCIAIVAEMLKPTPSAGAIRASAGCPSTGPVTLANRWTRRGPRTAAERVALVEASSWLRDARLYDAVLSVVRDGTLPTPDRLAGLRVLVGYAEDGSSVMQQGTAYGDRAAELSGGRVAAVGTTVAGSNALPATVREDVRRELARLASQDRDGDMRFAAKRASATLGVALTPGGKAARYRKP